VTFIQELGGESYAYRAGPLENRILCIQSRTSGEHSLYLERMVMFSRNIRLPCVEEQFALALKGWHV